MSEKSRFPIRAPIEKPKHPLGHNCSNCLHVLKDPLRGDMVCMRWPPQAQFMAQGIASIHPPVSEGEWCGEFSLRPPAANG